MTRDEHLKFCKICTNRKMDFKSGLICSLTNKIADFEETCPSYVLDEDENKKSQIALNEESNANKDSSFFGSWKAALLLAVFGFIRAAISGFQSIFGIIFLILGIGWLIIALTGNNKNNS